MTNFEKIKEMSIEEMAHFLTKIDAKTHMAEMAVVAYRANRVADNYEWLKREVSEK